MQLRYLVFLSGSLLLFAGLRSQCAEVDRAVAEITHHGGRVKVDDSAPGKPVVTVMLSYCTITDDSLALLRNFPELRTLDLGGAKISAKALAHLKDCPKLRTLYLNLTNVTDQGLANLSDLAELREINLFKTPITNAGLPHLKRLKHLEALNLVQTKVTDDGLRELQRALPNLKFVR